MEKKTKYKNEIFCVPFKLTNRKNTKRRKKQKQKNNF